MQYSLTHRTNAMTQLAADVGPNAVVKIFTGPPPANCGTADTGTLLATFPGNALQFGLALLGVLTVSAIGLVLASGTGVAGYFRVYPNAVTTTNAVIQGTVFQSTPMVTALLTVANSEILNFASTTGIQVGMSVTGAGIMPSTTVLAVTSTTVTLNQVSQAGVAAGVTLTFGGDFTTTNANIAAGQAMVFTAMTVTAFGA